MAALYHLTDEVDFKLDAERQPANNTTWGGDWPEPGIFLSSSPEYWLNGYGYWRPWAVEFDVPEGVGKNYGREVFVPATDFAQIKMTRVLPLDGYCREEYNEWGWTESYFGTYFDTEEPIPDADLDTYGFWKGYKSPDARTMDAGWQQRYTKRVKKFASQRTNAIASRTAALPERAADLPRADSSFELDEGAANSYWAAGGCVHFALAMISIWPEMKIAVEYYEDHGSESIWHATAYDPGTMVGHDIYGSENIKDHMTFGGSRVDFDADPQELAQYMGINWNPAEPFANDTIMDAATVIQEMWDPDYEPETDDWDEHESSMRQVFAEGDLFPGEPDEAKLWLEPDATPHWFDFYGEHEDYAWTQWHIAPNELLAAGVMRCGIFEHEMYLEWSVKPTEAQAKWLCGQYKKRNLEAFSVSALLQSNWVPKGGAGAYYADADVELLWDVLQNEDSKIYAYSVQERKFWVEPDGTAHAFNLNTEHSDYAKKKWNIGYDELMASGFIRCGILGGEMYVEWTVAPTPAQIDWLAHTFEEQDLDSFSFSTTLQNYEHRRWEKPEYHEQATADDLRDALEGRETSRVSAVIQQIFAGQHVLPDEFVDILQRNMRTSKAWIDPEGRWYANGPEADEEHAEHIPELYDTVEEALAEGWIRVYATRNEIGAQTTTPLTQAQFRSLMAAWDELELGSGILAFGWDDDDEEGYGSAAGDFPVAWASSKAEWAKILRQRVASRRVHAVLEKYWLGPDAEAVSVPSDWEHSDWAKDRLNIDPLDLMGNGYIRLGVFKNTTHREMYIEFTTPPTDKQIDWICDQYVEAGSTSFSLSPLLQSAWQGMGTVRDNATVDELRSVLNNSADSWNRVASWLFQKYWLGPDAEALPVETEHSDYAWQELNISPSELMAGGFIRVGVFKSSEMYVEFTEPPTAEQIDWLCAKYSEMGCIRFSMSPLLQSARQVPRGDVIEGTVDDLRAELSTRIDSWINIEASIRQVFAADEAWLEHFVQKPTPDDEGMRSNRGWLYPDGSWLIVEPGGEHWDYADSITDGSETNPYEQNMLRVGVTPGVEIYTEAFGPITPAQIRAMQTLFRATNPKTLYTDVGQVKDPTPQDLTNMLNRSWVADEDEDEDELVEASIRRVFAGDDQILWSGPVDQYVSQVRSGGVPTEYAGGYCAAWMEADGTVLAVEFHAALGNYTAQYNKNRIRMVVYPPEMRGDVMWTENLLPDDRGRYNPYLGVSGLTITQVQLDAVVKLFKSFGYNEAMWQMGDNNGLAKSAEELYTQLSKYVPWQGPVKTATYLEAARLPVGALAWIRKERAEIRLEEGDSEDYHEAGGQCGMMAEAIDGKFGWQYTCGWYFSDSGRFPNEIIIDHCWNVMPDGSILDATHDQFERNKDVVVVKPSDPEYRYYQQYVSDDEGNWSDLPPVDWVETLPNSVFAEYGGQILNKQQLLSHPDALHRLGVAPPPALAEQNPNQWRDNKAWILPDGTWIPVEWHEDVVRLPDGTMEQRTEADRIRGRSAPGIFDAPKWCRFYTLPKREMGIECGALTNEQVESVLDAWDGLQPLEIAIVAARGFGWRGVGGTEKMCRNRRELVGALRAVQEGTKTAAYEDYVDGGFKYWIDPDGAVLPVMDEHSEYGDPYELMESFVLGDSHQGAMRQANAETPETGEFWIHDGSGTVVEIMNVTDEDVYFMAIDEDRISMFYDPTPGHTEFTKGFHRSVVQDADAWDDDFEAEDENLYESKAVLPNRWASKFCCSKCMYSFIQKHGDWKDVLNKAVRIYNSGGAQIVEQDDLMIKARVRGDNDTYDVIIHLESQDNPAPMSWACGCEWGFWAWQRQHDYRGRPCSHCLAAFLLTKQMTTPELQAPVEYELSPTQLVRRHNEEQRRRREDGVPVPDQNQVPTRRLRQPAPAPQVPGQPPAPQVAPPVTPGQPPARTVRMV